MKRVFLMLLSGSLMIAAGSNMAFAQDEEDGNGAAPVEIYTCNYLEGKGPADLDKVIAKWNKWADGRELNDYSAWTLTPFFAGPDQEFDVIWMGASSTGGGLGAALDDWLASGSELQAEFDSVAPCDAHSMFAAVQFKDPPEREDPSNVVIAFSDCNVADGKSFTDDVAPALAAWGEHRAGQGSTAGHWAFFPVYGGGGEEFDFKFVASHGNLAEQGADFDSYDSDKARELFAGNVSCDSSRVYMAQNRRMGESDDD
jgi:hypothetical protein